MTRFRLYPLDDLGGDSTMPWRRCWAAVAATLAAASAAAAPIDTTCWLVLRDGPALAARCPYEVKAGNVVFRGVDGVLAALPVEQVDLAATAAARSTPSPRESRNVWLGEPSAASVSAVGIAGEAAKRAGLKGAFIDLSRVVVPEPELETPESKPPQARAEPPKPAPKPVRTARGPSPRTSDRLPKIRLKRRAKPPA
jgi:hypothetical protein